MTPNEKDELNKVRGREIALRYKKINVTLGRIKRDYKILLTQTSEFALLFSTIQTDHKSRMGWWFTNYCSKVDHGKIKRWMSIANRTKDVSGLPQSWQLKLFGLMVTVHHTNRQKGKTSTRRKKTKSFVFYIGKGHNLLVKKIDELGGVDNLSLEEREMIVQQFGATGELLKRISK